MEDTSMNYTEFKQTVRKNALANPNLYEGRYTCKSCKKAYEQYKQDKLSRLNKINRQETPLDTLTLEQEHDLLQHTTRSDLQQMRLIYRAIQAEEVSTDELIWLQDHKQEVLATNDARLCEWAGITEEEYNNGKLEE